MPHTTHFVVAGMMKLGVIGVCYSQSELKLAMDEILEVERLDYASVWTVEAYGSDALTPDVWILAKITNLTTLSAFCNQHNCHGQCKRYTAFSDIPRSIRREMQDKGQDEPDGHSTDHTCGRNAPA